MLIGYDLSGFIDGTLPCPSPVLSDSVNSLNPDLTFWIRQDSLLLSAILALLSLEVHRFVSNTKTSRNAWQKLALTFAKPSHPRLMQLRDRLIRAQGSCSIVDYLQDVKAAADELSLIDNPVSNDDLTLYSINGLSTDFETISAAFRMRDTSISFEELCKKILEHDNYRKRLEHKSDTLSMTVHSANKFSSKSPTP